MKSGKENGKEMKLNEEDILPLYKQLSETIGNDILSGEYPEGSRLPSEAELSKYYQVSRITVRAALKELAEADLVVRKQGKGTFVGKKKLSRDLSTANSFTQACLEMNRIPGARLISSSLEPATEADCEFFRLPYDTQLVCLRRLRYASGIPMSVEEDRFPIRYSFLLNEDMNNISLLDLLREKYNITFHDIHRTIEVVYAPGHIAKLLNCSTRTPMMYIVSTGLETMSNMPGQRSLQYIIGENFKLTI